jgi:TonB-linked SusC/RagA family outer membrane protein
MLIATLVAAWAPSAMAQAREVSGTIKRADDGRPLGDVIVSLVGGRQTTVRSNAAGRYAISVPAGPVQLLVRAIGFVRQHVPIAANQSTADVALKEDVFKLEDVVVSGQQTAIERRNAATSSSVIDGGSAVRVEAPTLDKALAGRVAGANIQTNSGAPGGGAQIIIRGTNTINAAADPLIVVDGVIFSNATLPTGLYTATGSSSNPISGATQDDGSNRLADLNPNDIERIEILKSAAASSIYGSKAANGVVVITTRRGATGKTRAEITQRFGYSELLRGFKPRAFTVDEAIQVFSTDSATILPFLVNGKLPVYDHTQELAGNKPLGYETVFSLSGGSERTKFYTSAEIKDENGIIGNTGAARQALRVNLDQKLTDKLNLKLSTGFARSVTDKGFTNNDNLGASVTYALAYIPSFVPLTQNPDGSWPAPAFSYAGANPLQTAALAVNNEQVLRNTSSASLTWMVHQSDRSSFQLVAAGGSDFFSQNATVFSPPELFFEAAKSTPGTSSRSNADSRFVNWNANAIHSYAPVNSSWRATTSVGAQYEDRRLSRTSVTARGLLPGQENIDKGSVFGGQIELTSLERTFALYGQEELLALNEKLLITGGLRAERSSVFGNTDKFYLFPKVAASYRFPSLLGKDSDFKLRAAYGQTGNQPLFGQKFTSLNGRNTISGLATTVTGTTAGTLDLKPETVKEFEGGFDGTLAAGRVSFEVTGFVRHTTDLLLSRTPAPSTGYGTVFLNGGELKNWGLEASLGITPVQSRSFRWLSQTSFQLARNKVVSLPIPNFRPFGAGFGLAYGEFFIEVGKPINQIIGTTGLDANGDPIVGFLGTSTPDFKIGFNNDISFKNFTVGMLWDWQKGGVAQNQTLSLYDCNQLSEDSGLPSGQARANACLNEGIATPFVQSTTYLRLRELSIEYEIPRRIAQKLFRGAEVARISLSGRNLLLFTDYTGYDPESSNFGQQAVSRNVDLGPYPPSRSFYLSVSVGF